VATPRSSEPTEPGLLQQVAQWLGLANRGVSLVTNSTAAFNSLSSSEGTIDPSAAANILGAAGAALSIAGVLADNVDVSRAGQATSAVAGAANAAITVAGYAAGAEVGAEAAGELTLTGLSAGLGAVVAVPALFYSGFSIAWAIEDAAEIKGDTASAKQLLANVPGIVRYANDTVAGLASLDLAHATTDELRTLAINIESARTQLNAIDHVFKGGVTIAGRPITTGWESAGIIGGPTQVAINIYTVRIQDELGRRGVAGPRDLKTLLPVISLTAYQQFDPNGDHIYPDVSPTSETDPAERAAFMAQLNAIPLGQFEVGLTRLLARYGLRPLLADFGARVTNLPAAQPRMAPIPPAPPAYLTPATMIFDSSANAWMTPNADLASRTWDLVGAA